MTTHRTGRRVGATAAGTPSLGDVMSNNPQTDDRRDRYATALAQITVGHRAFIKVDVQAEYRRAEAVMAVADAEQTAARAEVLREVADICDEAGANYTAKALNDHAAGAYELMERFQRKANEAEYVATPCSVGGCEPGGEPCSTHERLMAHGEGDHELCAPDCGEHPAVLPAVPVPPTTHATVLREAAAYAEGDQLGIHPELDAVRAEIAAGLRRMADEEQQADIETLTPQELAHAIDNSTPYPVELDGDLCRFMAERLLEMLSVRKRPEHPVWQPEEEPPATHPEPMDPETLSDRLRCPQCGDDITDYSEDDFVYRTDDDRPYCSGECVVAAHRAAVVTEQPAAADGGEETSRD